MKTINSIFNYIIVFIILGYGGFFLYQKNHPQANQVEKIDQASKNVEEVVNKYLEQTTLQIEKEKLEKSKVMYKAMTQPIKLTPAAMGTNPDEVTREQQISKDSYEPKTASEIINAQVYDQEAQARKEALEKKEYARQFKENARKGGYEIELDANNNVIKSTPIRKPSQDDDSVEPYPSD